jgi:hypothetical protein
MNLLLASYRPQVSGPCHVERLQREWVWERRPDHFKADEELRWDV